MSQFVKIATLDEIPEPGMRLYTYAGTTIVVYRVAGSVYATTHLCSHGNAELGDGFLDEVDCTIECPLHGSRFDLRSGAALSLPAYLPLQTFAVRVDDHDVLVAL